MANRIRVLDSANRTMQRLGYLKALCALVGDTDTSSLATLGKRFIERVTKRVRLSTPFDDELKDYARNRLTDGRYRDLRKAVLKGDEAVAVSLEIQDVYLADSTLPSRTGKLVEANWQRYPYLGTSLDLIKKGTYSALTRSLVLLAVTRPEELSAFIELDRKHNPLRISDAQSIVLLYCLLDNDADVLIPLFQNLLASGPGSFDEKTAGDMLPDILRQIVKQYQDRTIRLEERERLTVINKVAASIEKWRNKPYTGGGARQEAITVRLEPFCDLGFLKKPNRDRYEYNTTNALQVLFDRFKSQENAEEFLQRRFFETFAASRALRVSSANDEEATEALVNAGKDLKSSLGYSPITDVGLLAGSRLLTEKGLVLELARTTELLKALQKSDPEFVRFTVDRMGVMAHVKFLKPSLQATQ
jgi:hypothetical protein